MPYNLSRGDWLWASVDDSGFSLDLFTLRFDVRKEVGGSHGRRKRFEIQPRTASGMGLLVNIRGANRKVTIIFEASGGGK